VAGWNGVAACDGSGLECGAAVCVGVAMGVTGVSVGISFVLGTGAEQVLMMNTISNHTKLDIRFILQLPLFFSNFPTALYESCQLEDHDNRNHDHQQYNERNVTFFQNLVGDAM